MIGNDVVQTLKINIKEVINPIQVLFSVYIQFVIELLL